MYFLFAQHMHTMNLKENVLCKKDFHCIFYYNHSTTISSLQNFFVFFIEKESEYEIGQYNNVRQGMCFDDLR